jgi:hypothetical protein
MEISKRNFIDYFLLLFFIILSGIPFFRTSILYIPLFLILLLVFIFRKRKFDSMFILLLSFLFFITTLQTFKFNYFSFQNSLGVFLPVINGYLIVKILKKKFILYYINVFYIIAIISLIIYLPTLFSPAIGQTLLKLAPFFDIINISENELPTILIYNLKHIENLRNTGPFWEPGLYGGYLIIAFIFNSFQSSRKQKKISIVLFVTILTTLSTTTYLALFTFLIFFYYRKIINPIFKIFLVFSLLFSGYITFTSFDFLGTKIESQLDAAIDVDPYLDDTNTQRFLNILRDVEDFKGHEIIGRGSNPITRYSYELENQIRTVGLTDLLVRIGAPLFIFIMILLYRSICSMINFYKKNEILLFCIGVFLTILITLMSEIYFQFQLYWSLIFLHFVYKTGEKEWDVRIQTLKIKNKDSKGNTNNGI